MKLILVTHSFGIYEDYTTVHDCAFLAPNEITKEQLETLEKQYLESTNGCFSKKGWLSYVKEHLPFLEEIEVLSLSVYVDEDKCREWPTI